MDQHGFAGLVARLGAAWNAGDAAAAADCFSTDVDYADPRRYRFASRAELVPFFDPGPAGHTVIWHRQLFDEAAQTGVLEYTYSGQHRYHGVALVEIDPTGHISRWREWQHLDDDRGWDEFLEGPGGSRRA